MSTERRESPTTVQRDRAPTKGQKVQKSRATGEKLDDAAAGAFSQLVEVQLFPPVSAKKRRQAPGVQVGLARVVRLGRQRRCTAEEGVATVTRLSEPRRRFSNRFQCNSFDPMRERKAQMKVCFSRSLPLLRSDPAGVSGPHRYAARLARRSGGC